MKINQRKAGAIISNLTIVLSTIITMVYTPIMIHYLGDAEYGVYSLSNSIVAYLGLLSLGFGSAYVRYYYGYKVNDDEASISKLNGLYFIVFLLMGLVSVICGLILITNLESFLSGKLTYDEIILSKQIMSILIINISLTFPASVFEAYVTANENYVFQRLILLFRKILNPLLAIPLLFIGYRSVGLAIISTVLTIISFALNVYYCKYKIGMKFQFSQLNLSLLKDIAVFSSYIFVQMITDQLNWAVDKIVLGKYVGAISVSIYTIGAQINMYFMQFSNSVSSVFIPQVNRMIREGEDDMILTNLLIKVGRVQYFMLMLILLGIYGFGSFFITQIWIGNAYSRSYYVTIILITPVVIPLIQNLTVEIHRAKNLHKFRSIVYLLIAVVNVICSIPLAKNFGPIGTSMGTALSLIIGHGIVMNWYSYKVVGLDIPRFWKAIRSASKGMMIPLVYIILVSKYVSFSNMTFLLYGILFVIIYMISIWVFSLNDYEKSLLLKPLAKLKKIT